MNVTIRRTIAAEVLPRDIAERWEFSAMLSDYQGGDPVGYGKTPGAAVDDLMVAIELHGGVPPIESM